jgi:hypothetical protein
MAVHTKVINNTAISASGSSAVFRNFSNRKWMLSVIVPTTPTGTTPSIVFALQVSTDGISFSNKGGALAAITAVGSQRTLYGVGTTQGQVVEPFVKVAWTVTGTSPNFPNIIATLHSLNC